MQNLKTWIEILQGFVAITAALIGGFWAWSRFVVERGLLPPSEMEVDLQTIGTSGLARIVEATVRIHNKGAAALVVADLHIRMRYLNEDEPIEVFDDPTLPTFGRVKFLHAHVLNGVGADERVTKQVGAATKIESKLGRGEFSLVPYDTFVQPGVEQSYSFVTALPTNAAYVLVRASFRYEMHPSKTQLVFVRTSRRLGMLQFSLEHIRRPHTIEKSFKSTS